MWRLLALLTAVALIVPATASFASSTRLRCRDGTLARIQKAGRIAVQALCDMDSACQGTCSFLIGLDDGCLECPPGEPVHVAIPLDGRPRAAQQVTLSGRSLRLICRRARHPKRCEAVTQSISRDVVESAPIPPNDTAEVEPGPPVDVGQLPTPGHEDLSDKFADHAPLRPDPSRISGDHQ